MFACLLLIVPNTVPNVIGACVFIVIVLYQKFYQLKVKEVVDVSE
jgi:hypothetical protein